MTVSSKIGIMNPRCCRRVLILEKAVLHREGDRRKCRAAKNASYAKKEDTENRRLDKLAPPRG